MKRGKIFSIPALDLVALPTDPAAHGTTFEVVPTMSAQAPGEQRAMAARTFMIGCATDAGPKLIALRMSNVLVGRLPDNHLALNHTSVSRRHAKISVTPKGVFIEDMQSQNGTTVNGVAVKEATPVRPGDILRIGHVPLYYFGFINPDSPPVPELVDNAILINPVLPAVF